MIFCACAVDNEPGLTDVVTDKYPVALILAQRRSALRGQGVDHRSHEWLLRDLSGRIIDRVRIVGVGQLAAVGMDDDRARPVRLIRKRLRQHVLRMVAARPRQRQIVVGVIAHPVRDSHQRNRHHQPHPQHDKPPPHAKPANCIKKPGHMLRRAPLLALSRRIILPRQPAAVKSRYGPRLRPLAAAQRTVMAANTGASVALG